MAEGGELSEGEAGLTADLSPGSCSCMTTRELQQHWQVVKCSRKPVKLLFDIPSTRIVENALSKYVVYQIVVIKSGSYDATQACIERRYSDFERLHQQLLQDWADELEDVAFPRKRLTGNFCEESIGERRSAFKDYLSQLYSLRGVRGTPAFLGFFTGPELRSAHSFLRAGQYGPALGRLQDTLRLQEKLTQHCPQLTVPTLCALAVCQRDLDDLAAALDTARRALPLVRRYGPPHYRCPLLAMLVDLAFRRGQPVAQLQEELKRLQDKQRGPVTLLSLKQLVVQEHV